MKSIKLSLVLLSFAFLISSFTSCKNQGEKSLDTLGNKLILNHTQGIINVDKSIFIMFAESVNVDSLKINFKDYFKVTPDIKGEISWVNNRTLRIIPEKLDYNQNYEVEVNLNKLFPNKNQNKYNFQFKTSPLFIDISFDGLITDNNIDYKLGGKVTSNGKIPLDQLSSLFRLKYEGDKKPDVKYISENKIIKFTIDNLARGEKDRTLEVDWDASDLGSDVKGKSLFEIPAKNVFKVLDFKIVQKSPTIINISFSSPLKRNQELAGLIYLDSIKSKPKYQINENSITLEYPKNITGNKKLNVENGIIDKNGYTLKNKYSENIYLTPPMPSVNLLSKGIIAPGNDNINISFEAINLNAVDIEVRKVYSNNILQFLQNSDLNSNYIPLEVGEVVFAKKVDLADEGMKINMNKWLKYAIDLSEFIKLDRGAIYNIRIGFRKIYSDYECEDDQRVAFERTGLNVPFDGLDDNYKSFWRDWYNYDNYRWDHRKNPCYPGYYTSDNFIQNNILATNIGLSVKKSKSGSYLVLANDLNSAKPLSGVKIQFYSYAQQLIDEKKTDKNGMMTFDFEKEKPHFIIASTNNDKTYLDLRNNKELSISEFDVSGKSETNGVDGFIYGDRGVWRPGDTLFLNFILDKKDQDLPQNYPVSFELFNPFGKSYYKVTNSNSVGSIYKFTCKTEQSDPTGNWMAKASIGNQVFSKRLKIETIKPNRLKIKIDFKSKDKLALNESGNIKVKWLNGLPAVGSSARINMILKNVDTKFKGYNSFVFNDHSRYLYNSEKVIFENALDDKGEANFNLKLDKNYLYPGMVKADFKIKAFEKSGDFSTDYFSQTISPYKEYVGIDFPKGKWGGYEVKSGDNNEVAIVVLSKDGKPIANRKIEIGLYNAKWRWWWDNNNRDIAKYLSDVNIGAFKNYSITTNNNGIAKIDVKITDRGAYLIRACDKISGHCSSILFYCGYYGGGGENKDFASKLKFQLDKSNYDLGDKAEISIPAGEGSRVFIAIENAGNIKETTWQTSDKEVYKFNIDIEPWMFPNSYIHVSVFKPLLTSDNDLPIRRYGIIPIKVSDKNRKLIPKVRIPEVIKPNTEYEISVSEESNKPMSYTISVVDEGLLDLTHYKTPTPYDYFYAKMASGVHSWDLYDYVIQSQPDFYDKIISIGGDGEIVSSTDGKKANRFKPTVTSIGPFYLEKGETRKHKIKMQNYSGSVRIMVVGANEKAYGNFEKSIPVKSDLMLLPTAPRVISPGESFELPVTVFCTSEKINNVDVVLQTNEMFEVIGEKNTNLLFNSPGEQLAYFNIKVNDKLGIGKLNLKVSSGKIIAKKQIEIDVDNPNPFIKNNKSYILSSGGSENLLVDKIGMKGTNSATIEFSTLPKLEIEKRISYLMHYPYGCIEQTTSSAFPLVHLNNMLEMPDEREDKINKIVVATIKRLKKFQHNSGGMSYWPGGSRVEAWGTTYATHFLLEAQSAGYSVDGLLEDLLKYLKKTTSKKINGHHSYDIQTRAYSLMVLSKAGKPNRSAMNYMLNNIKMPTLARWYLALAYAYSGNTKIANNIYNKTKNDIKDYIDVYYTYGSVIRDYSLKLMLLKKLDRNKEAAELAKNIVERFNKGWYSTQSTAYVIIALSDYMSDMSEGLDFEFKLNNEVKMVKTKKPMYSFNLSENELVENIFIKNKKQKGSLYLNVVSVGKPKQYEGNSESQNLNLNVKYIDNDGKNVDIQNLKMGQEFKAIINVKKGNSIKDFRNMVVHQVFPSGFEILNWRMGTSTQNNNNYFRYQDIRDDRVYSFFDLGYNGIAVEIPLVATYAGKFFMPQQFAESMYDNSIFAKEKGKWIEIKR